MDQAWAIGVMCGLIIVVVGFRLLMKKFKLSTDGAAKTKYDERQMIERGKGYRCAFFAYIIYNCIFLILDFGFDIQFASTGMIMILGILVAAATHVIYCIFHEAYWGLNNNVKNYLVILIVAAALNFVIGIGNYVSGEMFENDTVSYSVINLIVAVFVIVILVAMLIKWMRDKREVE